MQPHPLRSGHVPTPRSLGRPAAASAGASCASRVGSVTSVVAVPAVLSTLVLLSVALVVAWGATRRLDRASPSVVRAAGVEHSSTRQGLDDATDRLRDAVDHRRPR